MAAENQMDDIIKALADVRSRSTFWSKNTVESKALQLEIKSHGALQFPLAKKHIKSLIKLAQPAHFGWRDKTLLDKKVRNTWEIKKSQIKVDRSWHKALSAVLNDLKQVMGFSETAELSAQLHNMLIYEPGQFFEPHQDSEKCEGMLASLIVVLPSEHTGGTFVIDHQGEKKQFQTSRFPLDKLTCIGFYADCYHQVKKVTSGYRVVLTYNVVLKTSKKKMIANDEAASSDLVHSLRNYFSNEAKDPRYPNKWVYLLEHQYTQASLAWDRLKGLDQLRVTAIKAAAKALNLKLHLALADVQETWDCILDYDYDRYHYYDEEDDISDIEETELIITETTLRHWIDSENQPVSYKDFYVSSDAICWTKTTDEFNPFDSEYEGWMGNYGNTLDKWYHRAAIIAWREEDDFLVEFEIDANSALSRLLRNTKNPSDEYQLQKTLKTLMPHIPSYIEGDALLRLAFSANDSSIASDLLQRFDIKILQPKTMKVFFALQDRYGEAWCLSIFEEWKKPKDRYSACSKCPALLSIVKKCLSTNDRDVLINELLAYQLHAIQTNNKIALKLWQRVALIKTQKDRLKEVEEFMRACFIAKNSDALNKIQTYMTQQPLLYQPIELVKLIKLMKNELPKEHKNLFSYQPLFDYVRKNLKDQYEKGLRQKDDWRIHILSTCDCQDCSNLNHFLSSSEAYMVWPLAKGRRMHIHQTIDGLGIPVTHETRRQGSPHKLILTKTEKLYVQEKQEFQQCEKALEMLI